MVDWSYQVNGAIVQPPSLMKIVTFAEFGVNNVIFQLEKKNIVLYCYFITKTHTRDRIKIKISEHNRSTRV